MEREREIKEGVFINEADILSSNQTRTDFKVEAVERPTAI